jgi:hypothetical protein
MMPHHRRARVVNTSHRHRRVRGFDVTTKRPRAVGEGEGDIESSPLQGLRAVVLPLVGRGESGAEE